MKISPTRFGSSNMLQLRYLQRSERDAVERVQRKQVILSLFIMIKTKSNVWRNVCWNNQTDKNYQKHNLFLTLIKLYPVYYQKNVV